MPDARPADPSGSYIAGLDGLRALSVLAVITFHVMTVTNITGRILDGGTTGVSVFFVISGYLITALLLKEIGETQTIRKRAFWLRRAERLFPSLALMLLVVTVYNASGVGRSYSHFTGYGLLSVLGYFGNWYTIATTQASLGSLTHVWSLAVEEQFYLVWPLVLALVAGSRRRQRWLLPTVIVGAYLSALIRVLIWHHGGVSTAIRVYCGSDTNAECILWGAALAIVARSAPDLVRRLASGAWLGAAVLVALLELPMSYASTPVLAVRYVMTPTLVGLATCTVISAVLLGRKVTRPLNYGPLRWVGRMSYDLYLWHFPVILALTSTGLHSASLIFLFTAAIAIPASMISYELTRRIRHRGRAALSAGASPLPATASGGSPAG